MGLNSTIQTSCDDFYAFASPQEEWEYRIDMLKSAKEYLYISTYYIDYKKYGQKLLNELILAVRRGVEVWLLIDGFGQKMADYVESVKEVRELYHLFEKLTQAGGRVQFYEPDNWVSRKAGAGHHFKFQTNENQTALVSSGNISYRSYDHWNEYAFYLRGPVVAYLIQSFLSLFEQKDHFQLSEVEGEEKESGVGGVSLEYLFCDPSFKCSTFHPLRFEGVNCISEKIIGLIEKAEDEILISSFYFKPIKAIQKALLEAANRGVNIKVFHSSRNALPETDLAWIASGVEYMRLLNHNINIYENREGEHSKMLLFDGRWVMWGSYNLEHQAHDRLAECMLVSSNTEIVKGILAFFKKMEDNPETKLVRKTYRRELSLLLRLKIVLFSPFKKWL